MANALQIFRIAMSLSDNLDDSGKFDTPDNQEYKNRTLDILNSLLNEVFPYSDTYKIKVKGKRPICPYLTSFDQEIELDDKICFSVLTEGLTALLFQDENPSMASTHLQLYEERLQKLRMGEGMPAESEEIVDVYSGDGGEGHYDEERGEWVYNPTFFPHNNFSRW